MINTVHGDRTALGAQRLVLIEQPHTVQIDGHTPLFGMKVRDRDGREIGQIDGVLAEPSAGRVRFVRISSGGFFGIGAEHFVAPVESLAQIDSSTVGVDAGFGDLRQAPSYGPDIEDERGWMEASYRHFGRHPD